MRIVKLNRNPEGWSELRSALDVYGVVGLDIETTGLPGKGQEGALEPHTARIRLVQFACDQDTAYILDMFDATQEDRERVAGIVCDEFLVKVCHNAKFEIAHITRNLLSVVTQPARCAMFFCTELASRVLGAGDRLL